MALAGWIFFFFLNWIVLHKTRPSLDLEAGTMYKLKGQSSNMQTDYIFIDKELVRLSGLSS